MSARPAAVSAAIVLALVASLADCKKKKLDAAAVPAPVAIAPRGDPERGHALVAQFECNRCHDGTGHEAASLEKHCVHCHQTIMAGTYDAPKATLAKWQKIIVDLRDAPSLGETSARFRRGWIEKFLLEPRDLRPHLSATMPRLAITEEQARDIATYLANEDEKPVALGALDEARGKALFAAKGCATCHAFGGAPAVTAMPIPVPVANLERAMALAPDLRHARDRFRRDALATWIADPKSLKPDTTMPTIPMASDEARTLAAYVVGVAIAPVTREPAVVRLPPLARKVTWDEVSAKVFRNTCWHCHGEPEYAVGDGGPGNTGGFGFKPRGLNVAEYEGIASGAIDDEGNRRSVFAATENGASRLVRALLARRGEENGENDAVMRGMPLGLPSLSPEDVQLVESWIAQGRPR